MRQSTAHLAVVFCASLAVSSAPLSPNLASPALTTPMTAPAYDELLDGHENEQKRSVPQKRSVGGFAYHSEDQNELDKRATGKESNIDGPAESFSPSDTDDGFTSGSESDSENDVAATPGTKIQERSIPEIWTRSPSLSPLEARANDSGFEENKSHAPADEHMSDFSDDEDSVASDDETSHTSESAKEDIKKATNN